MIYLNDSILNDIKKCLGIAAEYTAFDQDIIIHINSVFRVLNQLGVGSNSFRLTNATNVWSDFLSDGTGLDDVKTYVYLRVRMIFDPPTNSFLVNSIKEMCNELEWRLRVQVDPGESFIDEDD